MNLIYMSNARVPSEKANTYQSFCMCEAFSKQVENIVFWYAKRINPDFDGVDPYGYYGVDAVFKLRSIPSIDSGFIKKLHLRIWFLVQNTTFSLISLFLLMLQKGRSVVYTRDGVGLWFLALFKRIGLLEKPVFFEAHDYSSGKAKLLKYVDGTVVINRYLEQLYRDAGISNILVAHDGYRPGDYRQILTSKDKEACEIVYVGNLFPWKGVYTLADASAHLPDGYRVVIVGGSAESLPKFRNYVRDNGYDKVEIIGYVPKKKTMSFLAKADVLVLPNSAKDPMSFYTSPLKLFEYMASKKPIVASRLPSLEEILEDRRNAVLFEPDNSQDLAEKIVYTVQTNTQNLTSNAFEDVQQYSWDIRAQNIIRFIQESL